MSELTTDTFFNGQVSVRQNRNGYRFSIDAVILAWHAGLYPATAILDLGTGCGIIPLILAARKPNAGIWGVEVQESLAGIAETNAGENGFGDRIGILHKDMKDLKRSDIPSPVNLVVSNPPYRKARSGRVNPNRQRALARHEILAELSDVLDAAWRVLELSGKCLVIYPAERICDILTQMRRFRLEPKYLRMIHSRAGENAKLVMVEGVKGGRPGTKTGPPLIVYKDDGAYTDEIDRMYAL